MKNQLTNNKKTNFTFIVPCYNADKYIKDCVESIENQNFNEITYEILCIDDCSVDKTREYLQELAERNKNIKVFLNEKNKGVAYSRNKGIREAVGKWVLFVDSDDLLMPNVIQQIFEVAESNNADAVALKSITVKQSFKLNQIGEINLNEGAIKANCAFSAVYNNEKLKEYNLFFNEELSFGEDTLFRGLFFLKSKIKVVSDILWYCIRENPTSLTRKKKLETQKRIYFDSIILYEEYLKNQAGKKICNHAKEGIALKLAQTMDKKFVKEQLKILKQKKYYPYPFRKGALTSSKNFILNFLQFLCPIKFFFWIYFYVYKLLRKKHYS